MPEAKQPGDRTPAQRQADHASLARLSDTLVPALVQKLAASGLGELEVREGDWRIRLRRPVAAATAARRADRSRIGGHPDREGRPGRDAHAPGAAGSTPAPVRDADPAVVSDVEPERSIVTSPAVGTFRPSAAIGTRVRAGDRIAIVDLLGIPQDVPSPVDGTLVEVFVQAGEVVEYGEDVAAVEVDANGAGDAAGAEG